MSYNSWPCHDDNLYASPSVKRREYIGLSWIWNMLSKWILCQKHDTGAAMALLEFGRYWLILATENPMSCRLMTILTQFILQSLEISYLCTFCDAMRQDSHWTSPTFNFERFYTRLTRSEGGMVSHSQQTLGIHIVLVITISIKSTYRHRISESKNSMLADT